jgi:hypothetical protein
LQDVEISYITRTARTEIELGSVNTACKFERIYIVIETPCIPYCREAADFLPLSLSYDVRILIRHEKDVLRPFLNISLSSLVGKVHGFLIFGDKRGLLFFCETVNLRARFDQRLIGAKHGEDPIDP